MEKRLICEVVCPIVRGTRLDAQTIRVIQIDGTAFCLADNLYLTAAHCIPRDLKEPDFIGLGFPQPPKTDIGIVPFVHAETWDEADIALVEVAHPVPKSAPVKWRFDTVTALHDVWTAGYPHAMDIAELGFISQRAFKGYTVSHLPFQRIGEEKYHEAYELSFKAPMGLSGAPLVSREKGDPVIGIMIANRQTGLTVLDEEEGTDDGEKKEIYYYKQVEHYGVAVSSGEIGKWRPKRLGMTIEDFVRERGLLPEKSECE